MIGFLAANWFWIALVALMLTMHLGHRGHGHGGRQSAHTPSTDEPGDIASGEHADSTAGAGKGSRRHGCC